MAPVALVMSLTGAKTMGYNLATLAGIGFFGGGGRSGSNGSKGGTCCGRLRKTS